MSRDAVGTVTRRFDLIDLPLDLTPDARPSSAQFIRDLTTGE